jgi:lipopolysaccharide biosynthesis protein
VGAQTHPTRNPLVYDFDDVVEFPPHFFHIDANRINDSKTIINPKHSLVVYDAEDYINNKKYYLNKPERIYKTVFPSWDNTARRGGSAFVAQIEPTLYKKWLCDIIDYTYRTRESGDRLIFINAWNEWAEGAHLEPCRRYGYANLQATADALMESSN